LLGVLGAVFVTSRCDELGLQTLEKRRLDQDMALVFKPPQEGQAEKIFMLVGNNQIGVRTRQAAATNGLTVQYLRSDQRKHSFAVRTGERWNLLSDTVMQATTKEAFMSCLKQHRK
jgi:hypothetical protein